MATGDAGVISVASNIAPALLVRLAVPAVQELFCGEQSYSGQGRDGRHGADEGGIQAAACAWLAQDI